MWLELRFTAPAEAAERLSEALSGAGAMSVDIADADAGTAGEQAVYAEPGGAECDASLWPRCTVSALFTEPCEAAAVAARAAQAAGLAGLEPQLKRVRDEDWVRISQSQFEPIRVADRLWIVPSWHSPPDPQAVIVRVDPGAAFGTGSHPTTALCLQWLAENVSGGETVIDYGCGSGILAIAAMKLGAKRAVGVDIDATAVATARSNAAANAAGAEFMLPGAELEPATIVVANILANPLKALQPVLTRLTAPGGRLVLSGILAVQEDQLIECYGGDLPLTRYRESGGWVCLAGRKSAQ